MKKLFYFLIPLLIVGGLGFASAVGLVGDCGTGGPGTECHITDLGPVIKKALYFVLTIAILIVTIMIIMTGIKFMTGKDKAYELQEAKNRLFNVVIGIALITAAASITVYVAFLSNLGVKNEFLQIFKIFGEIPFNLVPHAYAQQLPNPTGVDNLYDFMLTIIRLVVRWFVYPVIVFSWFLTGFLFVKAQGNPSELQKAKSWLLWTFIGTLVVLMAQGFAFALRDTINQIFSS